MPEKYMSWLNAVEISRPLHISYQPVVQGLTRCNSSELVIVLHLLSTYHSTDWLKLFLSWFWRTDALTLGVFLVFKKNIYFAYPFNRFTFSYFCMIVTLHIYIEYYNTQISICWDGGGGGGVGSIYRYCLASTRIPTIKITQSREFLIFMIGITWKDGLYIVKVPW